MNIQQIPYDNDELTADGELFMAYQGVDVSCRQWKLLRGFG